MQSLTTDPGDTRFATETADEVRYLQFGDLARSVRMQGCADLAPHLPLVFPGWEIRALAAPEDAPILAVSREEGEYRFRGYWLDDTLRRRDTLGALSALVAEVMRAWVCSDDRQLCLHGAAADFDGRLVVFPNRYRAGKSLFGACLAAAGIPLFTDDMLPIGIDDGRGIAPGLAPRLRVPLPDTLDAASKRYIERYTALRGEHYLYLDLAAEVLAERGRRAPIGAFVLLEREPGVAAALEPVSPATMLKQVVWQNFAREAEAPRILDALTRIVSGARLYRLRYDRTGDGVRLLTRELRLVSEVNPGPGARVIEDHAPDSTAAAVPAGHVGRRPGVRMVVLEDQCFLAEPRGRAIHHLNQVGAAIWSLLAEPVSVDQIATLLAAAFPASEPGQLENDLYRLLEELRDKQLIDSGSAADATDGCD